MNDSQTHLDFKTNKPREPRWLFLTITEWAVVAVVLVVVTAMLAGTPAWHRHRHTCVICRMERTDLTSPLGQTTSTFRETSCSKWYPAHVEATHDHLWAANPTMQSVNAYGEVGGAGDNEQRPGRAIWRLTPEEQVEIYEHFSQPLQAKRLFISLLSLKVMHGRGDMAILGELRAWRDAGFDGDWDPNEEISSSKN